MLTLNFSTTIASTTAFNSTWISIACKRFSECACTRCVLSIGIRSYIADSSLCTTAAHRNDRVGGVEAQAQNFSQRPLNQIQKFYDIYSLHRFKYDSERRAFPTFFNAIFPTLYRCPKINKINRLHKQGKLRNNGSLGGKCIELFVWIFVKIIIKSENEMKCSVVKWYNHVVCRTSKENSRH